MKKFDVLVKVLACGISIAAEEYRPLVDEAEKDANYKTLGTDISGIVQSVGSDVKTLQVGDHVAGNDADLLDEANSLTVDQTGFVICASF